MSTITFESMGSTDSSRRGELNSANNLHSFDEVFSTWKNPTNATFKNSSFVTDGLLPGVSLEDTNTRATTANDQAKVADKGTTEAGSESRRANQADNAKTEYMKSHMKIDSIPEGTNLWRIASQELKNRGESTDMRSVTKEIDRIAKLNGIKDIDKIYAGKPLKLYDEKMIGSTNTAARTESAPKNDVRLTQARPNNIVWKDLEDKTQAVRQPVEQPAAKVEQPVEAEPEQAQNRPSNKIADLERELAEAKTKSEQLNSLLEVQRLESRVAPDLNARPTGPLSEEAKQDMRKLDALLPLVMGGETSYLTRQELNGIMQRAHARHDNSEAALVDHINQHVAKDGFHVIVEKDHMIRDSHNYVLRNEKTFKEHDLSQTGATAQLRDTQQKANEAKDQVDTVNSLLRYEKENARIKPQDAGSMARELAGDESFAKTGQLSETTTKDLETLILKNKGNLPEFARKLNAELSKNGSPYRLNLGYKDGLYSEMHKENSVYEYSIAISDSRTGQPTQTYKQQYDSAR